LTDKSGGGLSWFLSRLASPSTISWNCALVEGFLAGRVVRRVHDVDNLGATLHHDLEPLSQGYGRGSATLAASAHRNEEVAVPNVDD
jgi:hypothetical protein